MISRLARAPARYDEADQTEVRRTIEIINKRVAALSADNAAAALKAKLAADAAQASANTAQSSANTAQSSANTAQSSANTAQSSANTANVTANSVKTLTDLGFDPQGRLKSGVLAGADIGGLAAGYVARAQQGVFRESFETLPAWTVRTAATARSLANTGQAGGKALSVTGQAWEAFPYNIAFDPSKLYRIRVRVRQISGAANTTIYVGVEGVAADGVTLVNIIGANDSSNQHYVAASGVVLTANSVWQEYTGWFRGWGTPSPSSNPLTPSPLHSNVRYIRPMFILNFNAGTGTAEIDEISIDIVDEDGMTRAYKAIAASGDLSRGASGSVAIETLAAAMGTDPGNVLQNGSGQEGAIGAAAPSWTQGSGATVASGAASRFGDRSLLMANSVSGVTRAEQGLSGAAGDVYRFSAWVKGVSIAGAANAAAIRLLSAGGVRLLDRIGVDPGATDTVAVANGTFDWTYISVTVELLAAGTVTALLYNGYGGAVTGSAYFDGVHLEKLPPQISAGGSRGFTALDTSARLNTGVNSGADIAGHPAGYVSRAQQGAFRESFETLPVWNVRTAATSRSLANTGQAGGKALSATGQTWEAFPYNIAFDPSKLYRIRTRVRQVTAVGTPKVYVGLEGVAADGVTLVNIIGANDSSNQHYVAVAGVALPAGGAWQEFTGWFKGWGNYSPSSNPLTPSPLHSAVRYIRPLFLLNAEDGGGSVAEIDEISIDLVEETQAARVFGAISPAVSIRKNILAGNGSSNRPIASGRETFSGLVHGASLPPFAGGAYANPPTVRLFNAISYEPGNVWSASDPGASAGTGAFGSLAPNTNPMIPEVQIVGLTASTGTVRARLRQAGTPTLRSDSFPAGNLTTVGASSVVTSASAPASDDTYTAVFSYSGSANSDSIGGTASISLAVVFDFFDGVSWVTLASGTYGAEAVDSVFISGSNVTLSATVSGRTPSSQFRIAIQGASGTRALSYEVVPGVLRYNTSGADQYANAARAGVNVQADLLGAV